MIYFQSDGCLSLMETLPRWSPGFGRSHIEGILPPPFPWGVNRQGEVLLGGLNFPSCHSLLEDLGFPCALVMEGGLLFSGKGLNHRWSVSDLTLLPLPCHPFHCLLTRVQKEDTNRNLSIFPLRRKLGGKGGS